MTRLFSTALLLGMLLGLLSAVPAQAQFGRLNLPDVHLSDLDPTNKDSIIREQGRQIDKHRLDAMSRTPRAGRDYTELYFKNSTRETIWVALRTIPFEWSDG